MLVATRPLASSGDMIIYRCLLEPDSVFKKKSDLFKDHFCFLTRYIPICYWLRKLKVPTYTLPRGT